MSEAVLQLPVESIEYRKLCESTVQGYRLPGIIDQAEIGLVLLDEGTTFAHVDGLRVPAITPVIHAKGAGYDVERSLNLAGIEATETNTFYYALPPVQPETITGIQVPEIDSGFLFIDYAEDDQLSLDTAVTALEKSGYQVTEVTIEDDQAGINNQQASISLYGFRTPEAVASQSMPIRALVMDYNNRTARAIERPQGAHLFTGDTLGGDLVEELWSIYQERFQWLGQNHPVSMEDTKEEFLGLITASDSVASIYFEQGIAKCFAYFTDNVSNVYWLNSEYLTNSKVGLQTGERALFWPGIVARPDNALNYAESVIGLVTKVIYDQHAPFRIIFENTNRSEVYIPSLVKRYIDGAGVIIDMPAIIDRQIYRCLKFTKLSA